MKLVYNKEEMEQAKIDLFNIGKTNGLIATAKAVVIAGDYDENGEEI